MLQRSPLKSTNSSFMDKKGKITIPAKIRKELKFSAGMEFSFLETEEGLLLIPLLTQDELEKIKINSKELKEIYEEDQLNQLEREK